MKIRQNSVALIYTNNNQLEDIINEEMLFIIAMKRQTI